MKRDQYLIFIGVAIFIAGVALLASPTFRGIASDFSKTIIEKSSKKYGVLYVLQHTVGSKVQLTNDRYYAVVLNKEFVDAVTPSVISIDDELHTVVNKVVYVDNQFLMTGDGYAVLKLTVTGGTAVIVAKVTLNGNVVNVEPLYGTFDIGPSTFYLLAIPGAGFSFKEYKRLTPEVKPFFQLSYPLDPVSKQPIRLS